MKNEQRRNIAERVFERIRSAGFPMETDPRFLAWIEQWIAGEIEMPQFRQNYLQLLVERVSQQKLSLRRMGSDHRRMGVSDHCYRKVSSRSILLKNLTVHANDI
ncbi:MAG: hypothetical protein IH622_17215 [Ochrobactrum anthropi]|uniref:Uncharacterized protein n=1 Tax=Brucella anthropi TaxID=529 RepID=A0A8I0N6N4_BRUAN|nr:MULTISPECIES: hypothetical protein [Hyphomicrobiales]MBE0562548.1 hypothetical protein [Brucella anthropi]